MNEGIDQRSLTVQKTSLGTSPQISHLLDLNDSELDPAANSKEHLVVCLQGEHLLIGYFQLSGA